MSVSTRTAFLSSTGRDLRDYRELAYRAIEGLVGWHCVRMEDFGAYDAAPLEVCLERVRDCDLFVGLIGHSYGSCPPAPHSGASFTEHEYDAAIRFNKPRLMFVASGGLLTPAGLPESEESHQRQQAFRSRVMTERVTPFFDSPEPLATRVIQAIANWISGKRPAGEADPVAGAAPLFDVPLSRNPFFTGREDTLEALRRALTGRGIAAITGLGGIGKSQTAAEYAYRYRTGYRVVCWLDAASMASLDRGIADLAAHLQLPGADPADPARTHAALRRWLEFERNWLLIFDSANEPKMVRSYLPAAPTGHLLITSRNPVWPRVRDVISLGTWPRSHSIDFLSRRTDLEDSPGAVDLAAELGDLPLALEQAAAYIEATPGESFSGYLALYRTRFAELLGDEVSQPEDYPGTVLTTWEVSRAAATRDSPVASDLLQVLAFCAPEDIPRTLLTEHASALPQPLAQAVTDRLSFNRAVAALHRYSLIKGLDDSFAVHPLVQAVTRARLPDPSFWADAAIALVDAAFPADTDDVRCWRDCMRLRPHAEAALATARDASTDVVRTIRLMDRLASYLGSQAAHVAARRLFERALALRENLLGRDHPDTATSLNNLAMIYLSQGHSAEAEPLLQRALAIRERAFGQQHQEVAESLDNIAQLYYDQGQYEKAEALLHRALATLEQTLGPRHPRTATCLNNLASVVDAQGRYAEAEPLHQRALDIREQVLGAHDPDVATSLNNLALLYESQGRYAEAEPLLRRTLAILEQTLGPRHPRTATCLGNLASVLDSQLRHGEAEPLHQRALADKEQTLGPQHPDVALALNQLAVLYSRQGRHAAAEPLLRRALAIVEQTLGPPHPRTATYLINLASALRNLGRRAEGEPLVRRALTITEQTLGPRHPDVASGLLQLALFHEGPDRHAVVEPLLRRALAILEQTAGPRHPHAIQIAQGLGNCEAASLWSTRSRYSSYYRSGTGATLEPLVVTPIIVAGHSSLFPAERGWHESHALFTQQIPRLRQRIEADTGVRVPGFHFGSDDARLAPNRYRIMFHEAFVSGGEVRPGLKFCPGRSPEGASGTAGNGSSPGEAAMSPKQGGSPGSWLPPTMWSEAETAGLELWDHFEFILHDLNKHVRANLPCFLRFQDVAFHLKRWCKEGEEPEDRDRYVKRVLPDFPAKLCFVRMIQALAEERVPLTDLEVILRRFHEAFDPRHGHLPIIDAVREGLRRSLPGNDSGAQFYTFSADVEAAIEAAIVSGRGGRYLTLDPNLATRIMDAARTAGLGEPGRQTVLITHRSGIRRFVMRLLQDDFPEVLTLSSSELLPNLRADSVRTIELGDAPA